MICVANYTLTKELIMPNRVGTYIDVNNPTGGPQNLVIGTLGIDTDYLVYVWREDIDKLKRLEATTDEDGLLTINTNDFGFGWFRQYSPYYLWVTQVDANVSDQESIDIGGLDYQCLKLEFVRLQDYISAEGIDSDVATLTQTIEPII